MLWRPPIPLHVDAPSLIPKGSMPLRPTRLSVLPTTGESLAKALKNVNTYSLMSLHAGLREDYSRSSTWRVFPMFLAFQQCLAASNNVWSPETMFEGLEHCLGRPDIVGNRQTLLEQPKHCSEP